MLEKKCSKCKKLKTLNDFYDNKGHNRHCKKCMRLWNKKYAKTHKKQRNEYAKKYRKKYPNKIKKWKRNHKWAISYYQAKQRCENKNNHNYKYYGAKGIKMLMTIKDFKYLWYRDKAYNMKKPTIDRINNNKHYTLQNCRFIENYINSSKDKSKLSKAQVIKIRKLYKQKKIIQEKLAIMFNTGRTNIQKIVNYHSWKHI